MPMVSVRTDVSAGGAERELMEELSSAVAEGIGKPEDYVMVELQGARTMMGGSAGPAAAVDVRSIGGLDREVNGILADRITAVLQRRLGVEPHRVYIVFTSVEGSSWAWKGRTFR